MKLNVALLCLTATTSSVSAFQFFSAPSATSTSTSTSSRVLLPSSSCRIGKTAFFMSSSEQAEGSKATIKRLPNSAVEIAIPVPGVATQAAYDKVLSEISKNIQIPGFRKGSRIPPAVLEQTMAGKGGKNALKVQAINELLKKLVEPALKEQELDAIGQPVLKVPAEELALEFTPGQELTLAVKCDVWPEIQWKTVEGQEKPYTGLHGKYTRKPFNAVKLNKALSDLKERYATLEPITDPEYALKTGDACVVNMQGYMADAGGNKGDPLPNAASGDRVEVILGPGRYMTGLVEGLEGAKVGETVTVKVNFPEVCSMYSECRIV
jgi:trigger factor